MEILIAVIFGLVILAFGIASYYQNQRRTQALYELATRNGWTFSGAHDRNMESRFLGFDCLTHGDDRYAYNILEGQTDHGQLCAFDYHYETHSTDSKGNRQTHHHYFSAVVLDTGLPLKHLFIRPEGFWDKVMELAGFDDIDFELDQFNRTFYVKADDRRWAFDVLHQSSMEFLLGSPRYVIQFAGRNVIAYDQSLFEPTEIESALAVIDGLVDRLPKYLLQEMKGNAPWK